MKKLKFHRFTLLCVLTVAAVALALWQLRELMYLVRESAYPEDYPLPHYQAKQRANVALLLFIPVWAGAWFILLKEKIRLSVLSRVSIMIILLSILVVCIMNRIIYEFEVSHLWSKL